LVYEEPTPLRHSDEIAFGALATLRRAGPSVPEDISVIGIDNHPLAEHLDLSTVHQDVPRQGELAGKLVLDILRGEPVSPATILPTQLVLRGSTTPPRQ
jgi:DNA-binding LacI/PurR family transcriptional regulator